MMTRTTQIWCTRLHGCCQSGRHAVPAACDSHEDGVHSTSTNAAYRQPRADLRDYSAGLAANRGSRGGRASRRCGYCAPTCPATAASPPIAVNARHCDTRPGSEMNGRWSGLASDLDDPDIGHGVVVGVLRYDRDAVRDRSGRDPAIVHQRPAPCRAEPGHQQCPGFRYCFVHGERLEPLR
jgi:hypothetical protein